MGGAGSAHQHHHHHQSISGKISSSYNEDGVIVLGDEELKHLFAHYDTNNNLQLDEHELELLLSDLIEHTITDPEERAKVKANINAKHGNFAQHMFTKLDADNDGIINFQDFASSYHKILEHYLASH